MVEKLNKKTKSSLVLDKLRSDILNGTYQPGDKLQMQELKSRYQVGLSPLREALSRLVTTGLVGVEEHCGFYVSAVSLEELKDLYQLRSQIEIEALELSIKYGDTQWEAEILSNWHSLKKYLDINNIDFNEFEKLQKKFNLSLISGCKSPWMIKIHNLLDDQALRYRSLCIKKSLTNKNTISFYIKLNTKLVNFVTARNLEKSIKILHQIWNDSIKSIASELK